MARRRYFILGDPHIRSEERTDWEQIVEDINAQQPDAVLVLGDLSGGREIGTGQGTELAVSVLNGLNAPWYSIIGNHDLEAKEFASDDEAVAAMLRALGRPTPWFREDFDGLTVIGLSNTRWRTNPVNKNEIVLDDEQLNWWQNQLQELKDRPVLVLCHAPPIGSGLMVMTELHARVGNAYVNQNHTPSTVQQVIWEHPNVLFWFSGHNHLGQHYRDALSRKLGVLYAHTGTGSKTSARDGHRHSRVLEVGQRGYRLRTFDHGMRKYMAKLDLTDERSLEDLVAIRKRYLGARFVPCDPETMEQGGAGDADLSVSSKRFVFLSDAHTGEAFPAIQRRIVEWARRQVLRWNPDRLVLGGDLTQIASTEQAEKFLNELAIHHLPVDYLLGNNESASFQLPQGIAENVRLAGDCEQGEEGVFYLQTTDSERIQASLTQFLQQDKGDRSCLIFAHFTPDLAGDDLEQRLIERKAPVFWVCGHRHTAMTQQKGSLQVEVCGGLDPVKTRGKNPELLVVDWDGHEARVKRVLIENEMVQSPTPRLFPLGLAYQGTAADLLQTALERKVSVIQFHYRFSKGTPTEEEIELARRFRHELTDTFLSLHLPNFPDPGNGMDLEFMRPWLEWGRAMGVDDFTAHLPKMKVSDQFDIEQNVLATEWAKACLETYTQLATEVVTMGAQFSVENVYNKTRLDERDEALGTRPWHLTRFIDAIRTRLKDRGQTEKNAERVGMIFDVGHAFRDAKVAKELHLLDWIEQTAGYLQLSHMHQVIVADGVAKNHKGITDLDGPRINYQGLLSALNDKAPRVFPLLLEVRDKKEALVSVDTLRAFYAE